MGTRGSGGEGARLGWDSFGAWCAWSVVFTFKVLIYVTVAMLCNLGSVWNWTYEPVGFQCRHKPLPANNSGIKVLVYGLAKTGTTTMSRTFGRYYGNSWQGVDWRIHLWSPLADEYWQNPKNGGGMFPWQRLTTTAAPAYMGGSFQAPRPKDHRSPDYKVRASTPRLREVLAERLSACAVEALAFDAHEDIFWDVYAVSPDAKVVMLNWRTYRQLVTSVVNFQSMVKARLLAIALTNLGMHVLPYNAVVLPVWDALTGNTLRHHMSNGTPMTDILGPKKLLFMQSVTERRLQQHCFSGSGADIRSEAAYYAFFEEGKRRIPEERLLEFNPKKNTMRDLCDFLEIKNDPRCDSGLLPNNETIHAPHERDHPEDFVALLPYFFFCHWASYKVLYTLLGSTLGAVMAVLRTVLPWKQKHKSA